MNLDNIEEIKEYIDNKNGASFLYSYLAEQYMERGKDKKAKKICDKGLNIYSMDPVGYYISALLDKRRGKKKAFVKKLKKCIKLDNGFIQAYQELISEGQEYLTEDELKKYYSKLSANSQVDKTIIKKFIELGVAEGDIEEETEEVDNGLSDTGDIDAELEKLDDIKEEEILGITEEDESDNIEEDEVEKEIPDVETETENEEDQYNKFMEEVSQYEDMNIEHEEKTSSTDKSEEEPESDPKKTEAKQKNENGKESRDTKEEKEVQEGQEQEKNIKNTDKLEGNLGLGLNKDFEDEEVQKRVEMIEDMFNAVNSRDEGEHNPTDIDLGFIQKQKENPGENADSLNFHSVETTQEKGEAGENEETRVEIKRKTKNKMEEGPDRVDLKIPVPTMTFVEVLVKQELYDQALDVLDVIQQKKEGMEDEVEQKREKIMHLKAKREETSEED